MNFLLRGDDRYYSRAYKRLNKVSLHEVRLWAMESLWATQRALEASESTGDPAALEEARRGAISMLAAVDALKRRVGN